MMNSHECAPCRGRTGYGRVDDGVGVGECRCLLWMFYVVCVFVVFVECLCGKL